MLGRKLYKTKLCILYQRGHCSRQSCSFAHGEVELRRFGGTANAYLRLYICRVQVNCRHTWRMSWYLNLLSIRQSSISSNRITLYHRHGSHMPFLVVKFKWEV